MQHWWAFLFKVRRPGYILSILGIEKVRRNVRLKTNFNQVQSVELQMENQVGYRKLLQSRFDYTGVGEIWIVICKQNKNIDLFSETEIVTFQHYLPGLQ